MMAALRPSFSASRLSASHLSASRLSASRFSASRLSAPRLFFSHWLCLVVCAVVFSTFAVQLSLQSSPVKPPLDLDDAVGVGANWLLENVSESDHKHFYCEVKHAAKFEVCLRMKTLFLDKKWVC